MITNRRQDPVGHGRSSWSIGNDCNTYVRSLSVFYEPTIPALVSASPMGQIFGTSASASIGSNRGWIRCKEVNSILKLLTPVALLWSRRVEVSIEHLGIAARLLIYQRWPPQILTKHLDLNFYSTQSKYVLAFPAASECASSSGSTVHCGKNMFLSGDHALHKSGMIITLPDRTRGIRMRQRS